MMTSRRIAIDDVTLKLRQKVQKQGAGKASNICVMLDEKF